MEIQLFKSSSRVLSELLLHVGISVQGENHVVRFKLLEMTKNGSVSLLY